MSASGSSTGLCMSWRTVGAKVRSRSLQMLEARVMPLSWCLSAVLGRATWALHKANLQKEPGQKC